VLAQTASLFGQRPSALLGVQDARLALVLDDALAQRLLAHQVAQHNQGRGYSAPPPGTTYEDPMAVAEAEARDRREQVH